MKRIAEGIEGSAVVVVCVTREYMGKVAKDGNDNCKIVFEYAYTKRGVDNMLPVVMEESMCKTAEWHGSVGLTLGNQLYCKLVDDEDAAFETAVHKIADGIRDRQHVLLPTEGGRRVCRAFSPKAAELCTSPPH